MARAKAIGVGAFVIGGVVLFGVGLFLIGDRRLLFTPTFGVASEFGSIAGLQKGATVRVEGMDAGEVSAIHVPGGPSGKFRVMMRVRDDLRPMVRTDSVASIQNDGLVGNKFVQIERGSDRAPTIGDQGTIRGRDPFVLADLLQQMSDAVDTVSKTVVNVQERVDDALAAISATARDTQTLVNEVGADVRAITESGRRAAANVSAIVVAVKSGQGTLGKLITDDAVYERLKDISADAEKAVANVRQTSEDVRAAIADFRGEGGPMKGVGADLKETLTYAREAMADLAENTEALKHNFFLRGFFTRRGFFDLSDISVRQYREGALEKSGRVPLRIWLSSDVLFARDASGRDVLSDGGRTRLDSAMSQFVRYPRASPIVVEGYAREPTGDERYLLSRTRAALARDYLVGRFDVDPQYIAIMPMGSRASHSPAGDTWDGVAVAVFVAREALQSDRRGTGFD